MFGRSSTNIFKILDESYCCFLGLVVIAVAIQDTYAVSLALVALFFDRKYYPSVLEYATYVLVDSLHKEHHALVVVPVLVASMQLGIVSSTQNQRTLLDTH